MDATWLKTQFDLNPEKNKADLAREIGLEPPAISKILGGKRQIKAHEYMGMRKFFGLPSDGMHAITDRNESFVISPLPAGKTLHEAETPQGQWMMPATMFQSRTSAPAEKIKIFKVQENAMAPEFSHGEHVVVDISDREPSPPGVFIISDGFGQLLRRCEFVAGSRPPKVRISAHEKTFQTQTLELKEFQIIGRVIARLQWL